MPRPFPDIYLQLDLGLPGYGLVARGPRVPRCVSNRSSRAFAALSATVAALTSVQNAVSYIVGFIVAPIATYVSDRWGRRWAVIYACFTM